MSESRGLLTPRQWLIAVGSGAVSAIIFLPSYSFISPWIGVTIFLTAVVIVHLHYASRFIVPFPHVALLVGALQYVFAAWFGLYHPHENPTYFIGDRLPAYYSYAGPVLVAAALGFALSLLFLRPQRSPTEIPSTGLLWEFDLVTLAGIACLILSNFLDVPGLGFLLVLLGNLRFVGVYGRMLSGGGGWQWRLAAVLVLEVFFATASAMFQTLLLWALWTFVLWVYRFRPKMRTTLCALAAGVLLLPALQEAKWKLRTEVFDSVQSLPVEPGNALTLDRLLRWLWFLVPSLQQTITFNLDEDFLAELGIRYNQGWIINRVMEFTPYYEPFAHGQTLVSALQASLLPRLLAQEKTEWAGRENMERFAGMELNERTAMDLGYAGEMYANFGLTGGVIACGIYALIFGWCFRLICRRAFGAPVWWSLVPFLFHGAVKAEDNIGFVLNWAVKAALVLAALILLLPHLRAALFPKPQRLQPDNATESLDSIPSLSH